MFVFRSSSALFAGETITRYYTGFKKWDCVFALRFVSSLRPTVRRAPTRLRDPTPDVLPD